jgi:hypothetical protein
MLTRPPASAKTSLGPTQPFAAENAAWLNSRSRNAAAKALLIGASSWRVGRRTQSILVPLQIRLSSELEVYALLAMALVNSP